MKKRIFKSIFFPLIAAVLASCSNGPVSSEEGTSSDSIEESTSSEVYEITTIQEALAKLEALSDKEAGTEELFFRADIKNVSNATYGEMTIVDDTGSLYVYGSYFHDGTRYSEMQDPPVKGDTVIMKGSVNLYNDTPQIKKGYIYEYQHNDPRDTEHEYTIMSIKEARNAEKDTYIETSGVVAAITYANGKVPNGVMLWDNESSIYVYGNDLAGRVKVGDKINLQAKKDYYVLSTEQANAEKWNYIGSNQLSSSILLNIESSNNTVDTSWIESKTIKQIMDMPVDNGETTKIFKTKAFIKKVPGSGFTNYNFVDLDESTYLYTYTQCNGSDFGWLDQYDGELHDVYLTALNAKSSATGCVYRVVPIEIKDQTVIDESYIPEFVAEYYASSPFKKSYASDPELVLETTFSNETHKFEGVSVSYTSSDETALRFSPSEDKVIMNCLAFENKTVTISIEASYKTYSFTKELAIELVNAELTGMSIAEFIALPDDAGTIVEVHGIVGPSTAVQQGFYLIDDTGIVSIRIEDGNSLSQINIGNLVVLSGIKAHIKPSEGVRAGQLCLDKAVIKTNLGGNHPYNTSIFEEGYTVTDLKNISLLDDASVRGFRVSAKLALVSTTHYSNLYVKDPDNESNDILVYSSSSSQFSWASAYFGEVVTLELALCNWNGKNDAWRCCPLAIVLEDGSRVVNNLYVKAQ